MSFCRLIPVLSANKVCLKSHAYVRNISIRLNKSNSLLLHPRFFSHRSKFTPRFRSLDFKIHVCQFCDNPEKKSAAEKILSRDSDLRDILKDLSDDFGVDDESKKELDDIRKKHLLTETEAKESDTLSLYKSLTEKRYREYQDTDSEIIYSYEEEQHDDTFFHIDDDDESNIMPIEATRGITGVFDIDELIVVLREERLYDIVSISIPKYYHYADYMVLANAKSPRHAKAVSEFVNKMYKLKKSKADPFIIIEGKKCDSWKVLDMGNIVLHIFLEETRHNYNIESLWLFDQEYDSGGQSYDGGEDILKEQLAFLESLKLNESTNADEKVI